MVTFGREGLRGASGALAENPVRLMIGSSAAPQTQDATRTAQVYDARQGRMGARNVAAKLATPVTRPYVPKRGSFPQSERPLQCSSGIAVQTRSVQDRPLGPSTAEESMAYDLAIVLPTYNESGNVGPMLERLESALAGIRYEVIFVDDDSPDGTADVVRRLARTRDNLRVLHRIGRRGLASACIEGILAASAPFVAVMDADMQHDESILPEMLGRMREENLDLVVGSRNIAGGSMGEFANWRVKLSTLGKKLSLMGAEHEMSDPMSGFFMVRVSTFERFAHRLSGIDFKILLDIVLSAGPGLRIGEVPYRFRQREHGESKLDIVVGLEYFELLVDKHL